MKAGPQSMLGGFWWSTVSGKRGETAVIALFLHFLHIKYPSRSLTSTVLTTSENGQQIPPSSLFYDLFAVLSCISTHYYLFIVSSLWLAQRSRRIAVILLNLEPPRVDATSADRHNP
jgi:hypothetical protein